MNEIEWPKLDLISSGGFKKGELAVSNAYTSRRSGKSWVLDLLESEYKLPVIRVSSDIKIFFDELESMFSKTTRQSQYMKSKSKQPRYVKIKERKL